MGDYGIKITRPGYGIASTEPREYAFNSAYTAIKIIGSGSGTLTVNATSTAYVDIAHSQSFAPMVLFFCELSPGSGKYFIGGTKLNVGDGDAGDVWVDTAVDGNGDYAFSYVDTTKFRLWLQNDGGSNRNVDYFYIFFGDTGES